MLTELRCPSCGRGYTTRWRLRRHIEVHVTDRTAAFAMASEAVRQPSATAWSCLECSRQFASLKGLSMHLRLARHGHDGSARVPTERSIEQSSV